MESQRAYYARRMKDGRDPSAHITKPRIAKLEELELDWDPKETIWCEMFEALVVYKKENGDCNVRPRRARTSAPRAAARPEVCEQDLVAWRGSGL